MAESAEVGRLIVKISTDLSDLKKGMDDAKKQTTAFTSQISTILKGLAVGVVANEIKKLTSETLKFGQELTKLSAQSGIAASQIASLKFAAERSNTSIDAVSNSMRNLSRVMLSASEGNKEAIATFNQFKIEYKNADGTMRNASDVMYEVADRIKNTDNQTLALAASQKILGKNAQEVFGFFKQGSESIKAAQEQFKKLLGNNVDLDEFAKAADRIDSKWKDIKVKLTALSIEVLDKLLPQFEKLMDFLIETDWTPFVNGVKLLVQEIKRELTIIMKFVEAIQKIYEFLSKSGPMNQNAGLLSSLVTMNPGQIGMNAGMIAGQKAANGTLLPEVVVTADRNSYGGGRGDGFSSSESEDTKLLETKIGEDIPNALEELKKKWKDVNKEIQDSLASTLQMIATGFGTAVADVIVEGKDFGEAMKELWKDIAKTIIAEIVRIIAQLMILFVWQQMTGQTGGGARGIGRLLGFRDGGAIGPAVHARDGLITGPFGEAGIPAVVHPNEIISPIDKFFDFVKDTARSAQTNITVNAGDRDPREIAYAVQLEIDRRQRGV